MINVTNVAISGGALQTGILVLYSDPGATFNFNNLDITNVAGVGLAVDDFTGSHGGTFNFDAVPT